MNISKLFKSLFLGVCFLMVFAPRAAADTPTLYFYYGQGCPHCAIVKPFIQDMAGKYPELDIRQYEVYNNPVNSSRLSQAFSDYNVPNNKKGVPVVFLNGTYFLGDTPIINNLENEIEKLLSESEAETVSVPAEPALSETEKPKIPQETIVSFESREEAMDPLTSPVDEENAEEETAGPVAPFQHWYWWVAIVAAFGLFYGAYRFWTARSVCFCLTDRQKDFITIGVALVILTAFFFLAKNISPEFLEGIGYTMPLPVFTFFIALVDGFNPCNLFVLTFLLALLVSASHSKARIYAVGFTFVVMVYLIYFLFMAAWLNIFKFVGFITPLRIAIAMIALGAGVINCKELLFFRRGITLMVQERHKGPLVRRIEHMKEVIQKGTIPVLISSSVALAAFASLVELPCTAGFPIIYTGILSAKSLAGFSYYGYLALYNLFYVLPLAVVITIFGYTFQGRQISQRQMQIIKFIGGLIMILLGIILLVNPGMIGIAS